MQSYKFELQATTISSITNILYKTQKHTLTLSKIKKLVRERKNNNNMTYLTHCLFFFFSCLSMLLCVSIAGSRPVHGPAYTNPSAFSPEAYDFFHPKSSLFDHNNPPENSPSSPSPSPSKTSIVEPDSQGSKVSSDEHTTSESSRREEEGRGETIGVVLGLSFVAFLSLGIYFVIKKQRANMIRTIVTHSDV